jgi:hypothetical protein
MTWDEYAQVRRYHGVVAVPLRKYRRTSRRVRGVLSIDVHTADGAAALSAIADGKRQELETFAAELEYLLGFRTRGPKDWR